MPPGTTVLGSSASLSSPWQPSRILLPAASVPEYARTPSFLHQKPSFDAGSVQHGSGCRLHRHLPETITKFPRALPRVNVRQPARMTSASGAEIRDQPSSPRSAQGHHQQQLVTRRWEVAHLFRRAHRSRASVLSAVGREKRICSTPKRIFVPFECRYLDGRPADAARTCCRLLLPACPTCCFLSSISPARYFWRRRPCRPRMAVSRARRRPAAAINQHAQANDICSARCFVSAGWTRKTSLMALSANPESTGPGGVPDQQPILLVPVLATFKHRRSV